jgi:hypothetical protein
MIARGKRRALRDASPLDHNPNDYQALKERNNYLDISHFQCSFQSNFFYPGATRFALLSACPWLSYSAPLALRPRDSDFLCKAIWRLNSFNFPFVPFFGYFSSSLRPALRLSQFMIALKIRK